MLTRLFPKQIDNSYRGLWLAVWLYVPLLLMRLMISGQTLFNTRFASANADSVDLDAFGAVGEAGFLSMSKLLGLDNLILNLLGVGVLIRYRALIPLMYLLFFVEQAGRKALVTLFPIARTGVSTLPINISLMLSALLLLGLALSLINRPAKRAA